MDLKGSIELTKLNPDFSEKDLLELIHVAEKNEFLGICIPPFWIKKASRELANSPLRIVSVIGFPMGFSRTEVKLKEIELAIEDGAHELDLVWNNSAFKSGNNWSKVEIARAAKLCHQHEVMLKVIIETSLLNEAEMERVVKECEDAGADFIKTSTGFLGSGAQLKDVAMIRSWLSDSVGIKASGGIKTLAKAQEFVAAGAERIGSSSAASWF